MKAWVAVLVVALAIVAVMVGFYVVGPYHPARKYTPEQAEAIALDFLRRGPTFKFDGIAKSVKVERVEALTSLWTWEVYIRFETAHSGYGNRTGAILLEVITPHNATILVQQGEVIRAIIDAKWDEINQKFLEAPGEGELIVCPIDGSPYVWTPIGSRSENFLWKCLSSGHTWIQSYPEDTYFKWKKAFLQPEFVRDYTILYLRGNGYETLPDPLKIKWTTESKTPPGVVGSVELVYRAEGITVTISYPVVAPENTIYAIRIEQVTPSILWEGELHQRQFKTEKSFRYLDIGSITLFGKVRFILPEERL